MYVSDVLPPDKALTEDQIHYLNVLVPRGLSAFNLQSLCAVKLLKPCPAAGVQADMDPPIELSEDIILNVLEEIDNTLRFSAY